MSKYLPIEKIIEKSVKMGVSFGKGNPYHRLRYFTKIGLLPNMVRRGGIGHYHESVIDKLVEISELKKKGLSNDDIKHLFSKRIIRIDINKLRENVLPWVTFLAILTILLLLIMDKQEIPVPTITKTQIPVTGK